MTEQPPRGPEPGPAPQQPTAPPPAQHEGTYPPTTTTGPGGPAGPGGASGEGNTPAIIGLVLGIIALVLVLISIGFLSFITLPIGIVAIVLGVIGRRKVASGRTTQGRGVATGGLITGAIATVLSLLALIALVAFGSWVGSLEPQDVENLEQQFETQEP